MNKLYYNQSNITSEFYTFFKNSIPNIRKTQLNIIPSIIFGMISSESVVSYDIAKTLKNELKYAKFDSVVKRINRFWNNSIFDAFSFWDNFIKFIIKNYKLKHNDKRVHITFDHMFSHDNYTIFMMSMRVGKQGIPLYYKIFNGNDNDAYKLNIILDGITYISTLFGKDYDLIFLADRWFNSTDIMKHIDSLGHTYCLRFKGSVSVYKDNIKFKAKKLKKRKYHAVVHKDVYITDKHYKTNIVISNSIDTSTPWIIATNKGINHAIQNYSYRFGSIECIFKNQKFNGFNLEKISNASLKAFTTIYTICCVSVTYLTILGTDYSKNSKCYKECKFITHKTYIKNGIRKKVRVLSLFNTGLTLFKLALNSPHYIRLPFSFKLYDI